MGLCKLRLLRRVLHRLISRRALRRLRDGLVLRLWRGWLGIAKEAAKETGRLRRLLALLHLLKLIDLLLIGFKLLLKVLNLFFQVGHVRVGALQRHVLYESGLREDVQRVRVGAKLLAKKILGVWIFIRELSLVDALGKLGQELLFLGSHLRFSSGRC